MARRKKRTKPTQGDRVRIGWLVNSEPSEFYTTDGQWRADAAGRLDKAADKLLGCGSRGQEGSDAQTPNWQVLDDCFADVVIWDADLLGYAQNRQSKRSGKLVAATMATRWDFGKTTVDGKARRPEVSSAEKATQVETPRRWRVAPAKRQERPQDAGCARLP